VRQAKSHSTGFQLSALSLVSATVIHGSTGQDMAWVAVVILILVLVVVVPAVWSDKGYRRKAGLDVLNRLLPWLW
jgi:glucose uptake protein GlcU